MGVEQDGLGVIEISSVFYEVKSAARQAKGNARGAQVTKAIVACRRIALCRCFIAMELRDRAGDARQRRQGFSGIVIDEQKHRRHERRQPGSQRCRTFRRDCTRAVRVQHEADGVGPGFDGSVDVLLARQTANLDAGAVIRRMRQMRGGDFMVHGEPS